MAVYDNKMMYSYLVVAVLSAVLCVQSAAFNNPVIGGDYHAEPGAIKVDDTYYVVTTNKDLENGALAIHKSTSTGSYTHIGYVFNSTVFPNEEIITAKIHKIGSNYHVYFINYYTIGVAVAPQPSGPYTLYGYFDSFGSYDPSIISYEDKLYLMWVKDYSVQARQLNSDGLSFASGSQIKTLLKPTYYWEGGLTHAPWYFRKGNLHYLFFSGDGYPCYDEYNVGVAVSTNVLGPYEKFPVPIIVPNSEFKSTGHVSVVEGMDGESDLIFFQGYREQCNYETLAAPLYWDQGTWPHVGQF